MGDHDRYFIKTQVGKSSVYMFLPVDSNKGRALLR